MNIYQILVFGIVQGVGFRPFVCNLANKLGLRGNISNKSSAVEIILCCTSLELEQFMDLLNSSKNKNIKIAKTIIKNIEMDSNLLVWMDGFSILSAPFASLPLLENMESIKNEIKHYEDSKSPFLLEIPKDYAICKACEKDLARNRFKGYPFTGCTDCGARFSIMRDFPYERKNLAIDAFKMCNFCEQDYTEQTNRRFHAQTITCNHCGVKLSIEENENLISDNDNASVLAKCASYIKEGKIIALKHVGGFALVADAMNFAVIKKLRTTKMRPHKPFALMCSDIGMAKKLAIFSHKEKRILQSKEAPILLLKKRFIKQDSTDALVLDNLSEALDLIAPNIAVVGIMLAYSALMKLLFAELKKINHIVPLIFTSANEKNAPIVKNEDEISVIAHQFDVKLLHDLEIVNAIDDSVGRVICDELRLFRNARGFAPLTLQHDFLESRDRDVKYALRPRILAFGANEKANFCLGDENFALISPYIGNLENLATHARYIEHLSRLTQIYCFKANMIASDMHPYFNSRKILDEILESDKLRAKFLASSFISCEDSQNDFINLRNTHPIQNLSLIEVQHHFAHFCAILGENHIFDRLEHLGIIWDGSGYGLDSKIWGGEAFLGNIHKAKRVVHLEEFLLLGGESAIKNISRIALSLILEFAPDYKFLLSDKFSADELEILKTIHAKRLNSVKCSSIGRLFDGVGYLLGIENASFDGESGMRLEAMNVGVLGFYKYSIDGGEIKLKGFIEGICKDLAHGVRREIIASKFFNTLSEIALSIVKYYKKNRVYFSGGVFANALLCEKIEHKLRAHKIEAIFHKTLPSNDECISFGQVIASLGVLYNRAT